MREKVNNNPFYLNEQRTLALMKAITVGKYINVNKFLTSIGFSFAAYNYHLNKIKNKYPDIYNDYVKKLDKNKQIFKNNSKQVINEIETLIVNGIEQEDGSVREFDYLDWLYVRSNYFNDCSNNLVSSILLEMDEENTKKGLPRPSHSRVLISSSSDCKLYGVPHTIIDEKFIRECDHYDLTEEEREMILRFFNLNKIPYNYRAFVCAAKRIINSREKEYKNCFKINQKIR